MKSRAASNGTPRRTASSIASRWAQPPDAAGAPRKKLWRCISAPERTREELRALMNGELGTAAGRGDLVRLALRLIVEEALEALTDIARTFGVSDTTISRLRVG